jgi:thiol:disulfide interchange protein DsbD
MKKVINLFSILILMSFAHSVWSYTAGFDSANPETVMHFIQANNALVYLSAFFGLGILLAFTPCVLPMVPILSGIIVGQNSLSPAKAFKLSLSYVIGMALTYALAGMLAGFMGSTLQTMMQRPSVIIGFSLIFVFMALSMFGYFELRLPASVHAKLTGVDHSNPKRSYLSVGLMGMLSTLVVSPCVTAPLIGVLSYIGQNGQVLMGGVILFVMALGMGIPLLIVGSGYGSLLPKTGPWMLKIKQFFGFVMLGIALWMVSRILDTVLVKVLWAVLLIGGSVCLGSLKTPKNKIGLLFQCAGVVVIISGGIILYNLAVVNSQQTTRSIATEAPFLEVSTLKEVQQQLEQAKRENKVVFVDFSANWCSDCQNMDSKVFNQPQITKAMSGLINIKVDISDNTAEVELIKKTFAIYGTPTLIFFDSMGNKINDMDAVGFVPQNKMLELLNKAQLMG